MSSAIAFRPNPASAVHAFCHAIPDRWHQMSVVLSAASCLRWVCKLTAHRRADAVAEIAALTPDAIDSRAASSCRISRASARPITIPYAQGVFFGMTHATDRALLGYAVLEGVTLALTDGLDALRPVGTAAERVLAARRRCAQRVTGRKCWPMRLTPPTRQARRRRNGRGARCGAARLARGRRRPGNRAGETADRGGIYAEPAQRHAELRTRLTAYRALYRHVRPLFEPRARGSSEWVSYFV